tara:strand:- start:1906 stop:2679 length:774 start_codon:yes stop_codon:yes gene_type:complete
MSSISNQNLRIYIPSLNRPQALISKTLKILDGIDKDLITIVVSNEEQLESYHKMIKDYPLLVSNTNSIGEKRNFIKGIAREEYIVMIDDDLSSIIDSDGVKLSGERIWALILKGFETCIKSKVSMWGICGYSNTFYMKDIISVNSLRFICGNFMGFIQNETYPPIFTPYPLLEDYYFSCKHFLRDKGIVKFQGIGCDTRFAKNKGGIQSHFSTEERLANEYKIIDQMSCELPQKMFWITETSRGKNLRLNYRFRINE